MNQDNNYGLTDKGRKLLNYLMASQQHADGANDLEGKAMYEEVVQLTKVDFMNIVDALISYFLGEGTLEEAAYNASELFVKVFVDNTYICETCGEIIFPKVTTNKHGIFVESSCTEIRGGKANVRLKRCICDTCVRKTQGKS